MSSELIPGNPQAEPVTPDARTSAVKSESAMKARTSVGRRTWISLAVSAGLTFTTSFAAHAQFDSQRIEGWPVFIHSEMSSGSPELTTRIRNEIQDKLHVITTLIPQRRL